jgi:hypothetical protein
MAMNLYQSLDTVSLSCPLHTFAHPARYDPGQVPLSMAVAAEARRIFRDRIVGVGAAQAFDEALLKALKTHLGHHGELVGVGLSCMHTACW